MCAVKYGFSESFARFVVSIIHYYYTYVISFSTLEDKIFFTKFSFIWNNVFSLMYAPPFFELHVFLMFYNRLNYWQCTYWSTELWFHDLPGFLVEWWILTCINSILDHTFHWLYMYIIDFPLWYAVLEHRLSVYRSPPDLFWLICDCTFRKVQNYIFVCILMFRITSQRDQNVARRERKMLV